MAKIRKKRQSMEFSKKIFYMISTMVTVVIIYSMALMWYTQDASSLAYLIPAVFAELATCTGFYFWKARAENKIKLSKSFEGKLEDNFDFDDDYEESEG